MPAHVRVKLAAGWRYDERARAFRNLTSGEMRAELQGVLGGATVVAVAPDYAKADPKLLSRDEENLARYVQIILPRALSVAEALHQVRGWDFVDSAEAAPSVSLP
jgi:hypothetical protein